MNNNFFLYKSFIKSLDIINVLFLVSIIPYETDKSSSSILSYCLTDDAYVKLYGLFSSSLNISRNIYYTKKNTFISINY